MKKILFILQKPPHYGAYLQETLDIVMTAAAFDQDVSILLMDKAIFHLKTNQTSGSNGLKETISIFKALPLYGIDSVYVESESLQENGLAPEDLNEPVLSISRPRIADFLKQFDLLIPG